MTFCSETSLNLQILLKKVVRFHEKNLEQDASSTIRSYSHLANMLQELGEYEEAKILLEKVVKFNEENFGQDHLTTLSSYFSLVVALENLNDYKGAKILLEKALRPKERNFEQGHPNNKAEALLERLSNISDKYLAIYGSPTSLTKEDTLPILQETLNILTKDLTRGDSTNLLTNESLDSLEELIKKIEQLKP